MPRYIITMMVILALAGSLLGQGLPHMIYGYLRNYNGDIPDSLCLTFISYIEGREFDRITERDYPAGGYADGVWGVNTSAFTPQPPSGARMFVTFRDTCRNEIGYDTVVVDNSVAYQISDTTRLSQAMSINEKSRPEGLTVNIYPNPFNSEVNIVIETEKKVVLKAEIYDILGNRVAELLNSAQPLKGRVKLGWDGKS
ncbi:MAG: T9SS type A sorting domain-containing protein, partial [bacterium]